MRWSHFVFYVRSFFTRQKMDADLAKEVRIHLEMATEANIANGMSPREARLAAQRQCGNATSAQERTRDERGWLWFENLRQDLGYALRGIRKSPGFAILITLTLTVGIGGNTACFSLLNSLFLRPLAYPNADRIVFVSEAPPGELRHNIYGDTFSYLAKHSERIEAIGGWHHLTVPLTGSGQPSSESLMLVSPEAFGLFGVRFREGRGFRADEFQPGSHQVVVLSHEFWQHRLGGELNTLGEHLVINGIEREIIGILEPEAFPYGNDSLFAPSDTLWEATAQAPGTTRTLAVGALLAPGVSTAQAKFELNELRQSRSLDHGGERHDWQITVQDFRDASYGSQRPIIMLIALVVGSILLIACINITNLILARNQMRATEISLRLALGASSSRIIRQLLTESMVLASLGGILGGFSGVALYSFFVRWAEMDQLRMLATDFDLRVLLFTAGATILSGLGCGLLPAIRCVRPHLNNHLKAGGYAGPPRRRGRLQSALVITESACTVSLLIIAALLLRSLQNVADADPGFNPDGVLHFRVHFPPGTASGMDAAARVFEQVLDEMRGIPGVESAAMTSAVPLGPSNHLTEFVRHPADPPDVGGTPSGIGTATPDLWEVLQIPLLRGRLIQESDNQTTASPTIVVNAELVRRMFANEADSALGSFLDWRGRSYKIVGIVGNTKRYYLGQLAGPQLYVPSAFFMHANHFVLRTTVDPMSLVKDVRNAMERLYPDIPLNYTGRLRDSANDSLNFNRMILNIIGVMALVGLLLATVGVFGVMAYTAAQRRREMGVRIALGATTRNIMALILGNSLRLIGIGMLIGCLMAAGASRLLSSLLYEVSALDPISYILAATTLAVIGTIASLLPAWRASRADPIAVLRAE